MKGEIECRGKGGRGCNFKVKNINWPETPDGEPMSSSINVLDSSVYSDWETKMAEHHIKTSTQDSTRMSGHIPDSGHGVGVLNLGKFGKHRVIWGRGHVYIED